MEGQGRGGGAVNRMSTFMVVIPLAQTNLLHPSPLKYLNCPPRIATRVAKECHKGVCYMGKTVGSSISYRI
jgi:hypothetical protein